MIVTPPGLRHGCHRPQKLQSTCGRGARWGLVVDVAWCQHPLCQEEQGVDVSSVFVASWQMTQEEDKDEAIATLPGDSATAIVDRNKDNNDVGNSKQQFCSRLLVGG